MTEVFLNTLNYLLVIGLGVFLRKKHILDKSAADVLMVLILNLTLPCLLINSSANSYLSVGMILYLFLGLLINFLSIIISQIFSKNNSDSVLRGVKLLASSGIDVGDFVLPFIQTFFPGTGVMILCIFNIGNTLMNSGGNYAVAAKIAASGEKFGVKDFLKRLFSSVTFDAYLLIIFMASTRLPWPEELLKITGLIGNANIFLVMLMIGLKLELSIEKSEVKDIVSILSVRLICAIIMTILTFALPVPTLAKIVLTAAYFGPQSTLTTIFAKKLGYEGSLTAKTNVIGIFLGMAIITAIIAATI